MRTGLRNGKKILAIALAAVLLVGLVVLLNLTKPYAVYADGTKVEEPCVVKAGDEELFLVEDAETAEKVVASVLEEYSPDGAQVNSVTVDKKLTVDNKTLKRGEDPPQVLTKEEAVDYVLEQNSSEEPLFSVTVNAEIGSVEDIAVKKTYQETEELYEGESEVKSSGSSGSKIVTNQVISVNGAVLTSEAVDTAVIQEASDSVIYKGTKERPKDTAEADYSGQVMGSGDGASIAKFAIQFCGNPYVYGGTSLTKGADCSGFVQSVFAKFGISLPRTGDAQAKCGKGVSYSEAKPGDLIYYPGHIAIYIGGGRIVHASTPSTGICISSATYRQMISVRRIVE